MKFFTANKTTEFIQKSKSTNKEHAYTNFQQDSSRERRVRGSYFWTLFLLHPVLLPADDAESDLASISMQILVRRNVSSLRKYSFVTTLWVDPKRGSREGSTKQLEKDKKMSVQSYYIAIFIVFCGAGGVWVSTPAFSQFCIFSPSFPFLFLSNRSANQTRCCEMMKEHR